ncbi:MAG: HNH endonuclease [Bdellovibrionales bacterium]|nr:HNH endonuclease [Bdellovibrionales bacterium]
MSLSKAQKMAAVLTPENQNQWFDLAKISTHKQLEKQVAMASPRQAVIEKMQYVSPQIDIAEKIQVKTSVSRVALQMGLSEKLMLKLRRAQDLESSRLKKSLSLEETLEQVINLYLEKKDPVRKAERQKMKGQLQTSHHVINKLNLNYSSQELLMQGPATRQLTSSLDLKQNSIKLKGIKIKRQPLPARLIHQVQLRDRGRCTFTNSQGQRCSSQRHLEIHHLKPVSKGGGNALENLALLCSGHHKVVHCRH